MTQRGWTGSREVVTVLAQERWTRLGRLRSARCATVAIGNYTQLWAMVPATDGGQSYEMTCKSGGGYGNIMGGPFYHEDGRPVPIE